jgi:hypothetical protein
MSDTQSVMSVYVGKRVRVFFAGDLIRGNLSFQSYTLLGFTDAGVFLRDNNVDTFLPYHMIGQIARNKADDMETSG